MRFGRLGASLLVLAAAFAAGDAIGQALQWSHVQRGTTRGEAAAGCSAVPGRATRHVAAAANGDLVVVGCSSNGENQDLLTVRYGAESGAVVWSASFAGSYSGDDGAAAVAIDAAGDVVVTGWSQDVPGGGLEMRTVKYNGATGERLWAVSNGVSGLDDRAVAIATSAAGHVYITGRMNSRIATLKLDASTGAMLWFAGFDGPYTGTGGETGHAIVVDANGDAYVTGYSDEVGPVQMRTFKYDGSSGAQLWNAVFASPNAGQGLAAALDPTGNPVVAGYTTTADSKREFRVVKYAAATGAQLWTYGSTGNGEGSEAVALGVDASGNVLATGTGYDGAATKLLMRTVKLAGASGAVSWESWEDSGIDEFFDDNRAYSLALDSAGNAVVAGRIPAPFAQEALRTLKYRGTDGARLWSIDHAGFLSPFDPGPAVAGDASGDVLVGSVDRSTNGDGHIRAFKYSGIDGGLTWTQSDPPIAAFEELRGMQVSVPRFGKVAMLAYGPTGHGETLTLYDTGDGHEIWSVGVGGMGWAEANARRVAIDAAGDVVVAGPRFNALNATKVSGTTGEELWTSSFESPSTLYGSGNALAIDSANDIVVAGWTCEANGGGCAFVMRTVKFAGATGDVLWSPSVGTTNGNAYAVAVDSQGHVIVTGTELGGSHTIKYHGTTGAELWNVTDPASNRGWDLALDSHDDVIAIGSGGSAARETRTVKYNGANGAEVWAASYFGSGTSVAYPRAVAVDASGDVIVSIRDIAGIGSDFWRTIRYVGGTGAQLWSRAYQPGTGIPGNVPNALAIDAAGNILLTGYGPNAVGLDAAHAVKYHGASGFRLWTTQLTSPTQSGRGAAIVTDAAGAIYVAATVAGDGFPRGAMIAKLSSGPATPPNFPSADLNGDGTGDLVWRHEDGRVALWLMNGAAPQSSGEILGAATGWSVARIADFDGNGTSDLAWQHTDGRVAIYLMNGTTPILTQQILNAGPWSIAHTPDVNFDGRADLVFQNTDGTVALWTMDGATMTGGATIMGPGTGWSVANTADFDADGRDDLLWVHSDGRAAIWLMDGISMKSDSGQILGAGTGWSPIHVADLDGDFKADIIWQHADGRVAAWLMNGSAMAGGSELLGAGSGWVVKRVADFDGDLKADLLWEHPDGRAAIWLMNGAAIKQSRQVLNAGDGWISRRAADLNGDGKADIVWENTDGRVAVWLMDGTTMTGGGGILGPGTGWTVSGVSQ